MRRQSAPSERFLLVSNTWKHCRFNNCWLSHRTLWAEVLSPGSRPCWRPCRRTFLRRPAGCFGWSACCVRPPAGWKCTSLKAPAAAPSCTNTETNTFRPSTLHKIKISSLKFVYNYLWTAALAKIAPLMHWNCADLMSFLHWTLLEN